MRVFSYRNLHRDCYSIRDEGTKRVTLRDRFVAISDASFVVGKKSRLTVIRTGVKNVHAGVRGSLRAVGEAAENLFRSEEGWVEVYYNPYLVETFVERGTGVPLSSASLVFLGRGGAYALAPR